MTSERYRHIEDEYFLKLDMEKIKDLREKLDKSRQEENEQHRMKDHWMRCPKCASELEEIKYGAVMIDRCTGCNGIWLDQGELELLTKGEATFSDRFIKNLLGI